MKLNIRGTRLLQSNLDFLSGPTRYIVHQGGSRSGKTYSIMQSLVIYGLQHPGTVISICRKTLPSLKHSVLRDFKEVMEALGIWDDSKFNMTDLIYDLKGSTVEFFSIDQPQRVRGRKRDVLFVNECNELNKEDFDQLNLRTERKVLLDFNPSEIDGWYYQLVEQKPSESQLVQSTFEDNTFLPDEIRRTIQAYRETDEDFWQVFGLGVRVVPKELVYPKWTAVDKIPSGLHTAIGIDFGFTVPSSAVRVHFGDGVIYLEELLHESYLTSQQIAQRMLPLVRQGETVWCDSAEPDKISELKSAGLNAKSADKAVKAGIDSVKFNRINVLGQNLIKEMKGYRWKKKPDGTILDEPLKLNDHGMDAFRYCVFNERRHNRSHGKFDYEFEIIS